MSSPLNRMRPDVAGKTPVRQLKKVLLPAPFGPMIARISSRLTWKLTLLTAVSPPNLRVSASVRSTGTCAPARAFLAEAGASMAGCICNQVVANLQDGGEKVLFAGVGFDIPGFP